MHHYYPCKRAKNNKSMANNKNNMNEHFFFFNLKTYKDVYDVNIL